MEHPLPSRVAADRGSSRLSSTRQVVCSATVLVHPSSPACELERRPALSVHAHPSRLKSQARLPCTATLERTCRLHLRSSCLATSVRSFATIPSGPGSPVTPV